MPMNIPRRGHYSAPSPSPSFSAHVTKPSLRPRGSKTSKSTIPKWLPAALRPERSSLKTLLIIQVLFMIATLSVVSYVFLGSESDPVLITNTHTVQAKTGHSIKTLHVITEPKVDIKIRYSVHPEKAEPEIKSDSAVTSRNQKSVASNIPGTKPTAVKSEPVNVEAELVEGKDEVAHDGAIPLKAVELPKGPQLKSKTPSDTTASIEKPQLSSKPLSGSVKKEEEKMRPAAVTEASVVASSRKLLRYAGMVEQAGEMEDTETREAGGTLDNSATVSVMWDGDMPGDAQTSDSSTSSAENEEVPEEVSDQSQTTSTIMERLGGNGMLMIGDADFIQTEMAKQRAKEERVDPNDRVKEGKLEEMTGGMEAETEAEMEGDEDSTVFSIARLFKVMRVERNAEFLKGASRQERAFERMQLLD